MLQDYRYDRHVKRITVMNADTLRFIRSEGALLLSETRREIWENLTGIKTQSRLSGIYGQKRDFLEPELVLSCAAYTGADEEEKARNNLLRAFLLSMYLTGKTASLSDRILSLEAGQEFSAAGKKLTPRSAEAHILSEPRKSRRDEIDAKSGEILSGLDTLCLRKLDLLTECSETLGFGTYGELLEAATGTILSRAAEEAEKFIRDTDYISGEMLEWFLSRKIDVRLKDASFSDTVFLFNTDELGGYFPKPDREDFTGKVLGGMNLDPKRAIRFDTAKRAGKAVNGFSLAFGKPLEPGISIYPLGGVHDYDAILGSLGHALTYAFTDPEDDFEFVSLRDTRLTDIFSALLGGLIYEPAWLKRYLKIDSQGDFRKFLNLRRLMRARLEAGRAVCTREVYAAAEPGSLSEIFSEIMSGAAKCRFDGRKFLTAFLSPVRSPFSFNALLTLPCLRNFMKESFDEEWWRTSAAGDFLMGIWSVGGRISSDSLLERCGCVGHRSESLVRDYEESFR